KSRNRQLRQNFKSSISKKSVQNALKMKCFYLRTQKIFNFQKYISQIKFLREIRCVQTAPQNHEKCKSVASLEFWIPLRILKNKMSKFHSDIYSWRAKIRNAKVFRFRKSVIHARIFKAFSLLNFSRAFYFRNLKGKTKLKIFNEVVKIWLVKVSKKIFISLFRNHFRSEEHTSELQSREKLVCRLLLEKK